MEGQNISKVQTVWLRPQIAANNDIATFLELTASQYKRSNQEPRVTLKQSVC